MRLLTLFLSVSICVHPWSAAPAAASGPIEPAVGGLIDLPMYNDPVLTPPPEAVVFHPRLNELWLAALAQPNAELRREAAVAFGRAGEGGMTLDPAVFPRLIEVMKSDEQRAVRVAAAETLLHLNHTAAAGTMLEVNRAGDDVELIRITDRALGRWRHEPAVPTWTARATDESALDAVRRSAIRALGEVAAAPAFEALTSVASDRSASLALRLQAGQAIGILLKSNGVTPQQVSAAASELVDGGRADQQVAAAMLAVTRDYAPPSEPGPRAQLLGRLLDSDDPTVIAVAIAALSQADPSLMTGRFDGFLDHADASVRLAAVHANLAVTPDDRAGQVARVLRRLDDPSVRVRYAAREQLELLDATPEFTQLVQAAVMDGLSIQGWRGLEQAALLAGNLDHEPAADRLVELLRHDRPEVRLAAAAALRQLAVPATLPAMLGRAQELTAESKGETDPRRNLAIDRETAQLFMAFGQMNFAPADPLMRQYIPKGEGGAQARTAALYALGKLHEDQPDAQLIRAFGSRLSDVDPMNPELVDVRRFAAIGLGRMNGKGQLGTLRRFLEEENSSVDIGGATHWAIARITGENLPPLDTITDNRIGWFLEPAE